MSGRGRRRDRLHWIPRRRVAKLATGPPFTRPTSPQREKGIVPSGEDSPPTKPTYVTRSTIKERGWTDALIEKFLPDPDREAPNPHYRSGAPLRLYDLARVERVEKYKRFIAAKEKTAGQTEARKAAAKKAVGTKRAKTIAAVEAIVIPPPKRLDRDTLIRKACDNFNARLRDIDSPSAYPHSDPTFLERITVNYLRHSLTAYDSHCQRLFAKVGRKEAYFLIRDKIFAAIQGTYPELSQECSRQRCDARMWADC